MECVECFGLDLMALTPQSPDLLSLRPGPGYLLRKLFNQNQIIITGEKKITNYFDRCTLASSWACLLLLSYHNYQIIREKILLEFLTIPNVSSD